MRFDFRTLSRAISTLVVLCVLFVGMGLDVSAHDRGRNRGRNWGRSHNRGRHLGWTRGRRVGQNRRDNNSRWRRLIRRDRRRDRRYDRRTYFNDGRNLRRERYRQSGYWRNRY